MADRRSDPLLAYSRETIRQGSRSFARASLLFDAQTRDRAHLLYAWCRYCDDQIDEQRLGHATSAEVAPPGDAGGRLARLEALTRAALQGTTPLFEPAFLALRRAAIASGMPERHPFELLEGFRWDVAGRQYRTFDDLLAYCYHVAGCVGVMLAHVMGTREPDALRRAADLGIAFQLTNIARDVRDDARSGRVYLPIAWLEERGLRPDDVTEGEAGVAVAAVVARLLDQAEHYYGSALAGLRYLPFRAAWAVGAAARIYREIGRVVRARGPAAWERRVVVGRPRKALALIRALAGAVTAVTLGRRGAPPPRVGLWTAPEPGAAPSRAYNGSPRGP